MADNNTSPPRSAQSSQESLPIDQAVDTTTVLDQRKQPLRVQPEFKSPEHKVYVNKFRDMRLFGNHLNAHS